MPLKKALSMALSILAFFICLWACFIPWYEYTVTWTPPTRRRTDQYLVFDEISATSETLYFFHQGPTLFPLIIEDSRGCYAAGNCGGCSPSLFQPNRLHRSDLSSAQDILFYATSSLIFAGPFVSLAVVVYQCTRHYPLRRTRITYAVVMTIAIVLSVCLVPALIGPTIGNLFAERIPLWGGCQTSPPVVECCPHLTGTGSTTMSSYGSARWELEDVLLGPWLAGLGLVLSIASLIAGKSTKNHRSTAITST